MFEILHIALYGALQFLHNSALSNIAKVGHLTISPVLQRERSLINHSALAKLVSTAIPRHNEGLVGKRIYKCQILRPYYPLIYPCRIYAQLLLASPQESSLCLKHKNLAHTLIKALFGDLSTPYRVHNLLY